MSSIVTSVSCFAVSWSPCGAAVCAMRPCELLRLEIFGSGTSLDDLTGFKEGDEATCVMNLSRPIQASMVF